MAQPAFIFNKKLLRPLMKLSELCSHRMVGVLRRHDAATPEVLARALQHAPIREHQQGASK